MAGQELLSILYDMSTNPWGTAVTDAQIAEAKRAWMRARDSSEPPEVVTARYDELRGLVSAQAQQIAEAFRAARSGRRDG